MLESQFKRRVIQTIKDMLPEIDLDFIESDNRSMPDTYILGPGIWAALEFKASDKAPRRPNQEWHINRLNAKGYARFVYPENLEEVLDELERLFTS